jgi:membrane protease subunit (stomatin/prohibitin family)
MASNKVVFQGGVEDVIWKSPITSLLPDTKIYSHKDCIILFMRQGSLLGAFSDDLEYNIVNEDTGGFKTFFGSKKGVDDCAVYYINKKKHVQVKWGTPHRIDVHDQGFNMYTSVGAHGTYSFTIVNPLKLFTKMKIFDESLTKQMINQFFSEEVAMHLRRSITQVFSSNKKGLRDVALITSQEQKIAKAIKEDLKPLFYKYGVKLEQFVIAKIDYDKDFLDKISDIRQEAVFNKYKEENELVKQDTKNYVLCDACGHKNSKDSLFCGNCGSKIITKLECPSCHKEVPKDAKFCHHCGTKIEGEK